MNRKLQDTDITSKKVVIELVEQDEDVCLFDIRYDNIKMSLNCYLYIIDGILILNSVDISGPGQSYFNNGIFKVIDEVCKEFCRMHSTQEIILIGAKRTTGRTKGRFLKPYHMKVPDL